MIDLTDGAVSDVLQFDRFDFGDESLVVVGQERADHVEHGVTEATDVHDVSSLASLNRLVRLQIDVDQLRGRTQPRASALRLIQPTLVGNEGFPSGHHTGRTVPSRSDPALVIANENHAGELAIRMLLVGSYQRQRTICSTTTVLCQSLGDAQDRIVRIDLGIVSLCIERNG